MFQIQKTTGYKARCGLTPFGMYTNHNNGSLTENLTWPGQTQYGSCFGKKQATVISGMTTVILFVPCRHMEETHFTTQNLPSGAFQNTAIQPELEPASIACRLQ